MDASEQPGIEMPEDERRALLTDDERAILAGDRDVEDEYYYVVVSRVRSKIQRLSDDVDALEQHDTLADELRKEVYEDGDDP